MQIIFVNFSHVSVTHEKLEDPATIFLSSAFPGNRESIKASRVLEQVRKKCILRSNDISAGVKNYWGEDAVYDAKKIISRDSVS